MKLILILITVSLTGLSLAACSNDGSSTGDARTVVTAAFYPLAEAARRVGGEDVRVVDLTPAGAEPHDLELTPDKLNAIEDADVALVMGHHFQPSVEDAAKHNTHRVVVLDDLHITGKDPHVWLDPVRMSAIVAVVAHALAAAAPSQADTFASRAKAYEAKLSALDADMRAGLATCERTQIVTAHDAFGWLAKRYHLTQYAITGITPDVEPNPQRLDDLAKLVEAKGVTTIFTETLVSPKVAQLLARETGVTTAVLNPLEGLTKKQINAGASYISVMRENLATLRRALGCA